MTDKRRNKNFDGSQLTIQHLDIHLVTEDPDNPRDHDDKHVGEVATSIDQLGLNDAIIVDENFVLIAGTAMWRACVKLGFGTIPTIVLSHLAPAEKAAFRIAHNRLCEKGAWNPELLVKNFQFILDNDFEFDLEVVGFETPEIDVFMLGGKAAITAAAALAAEEPENVEMPDLPAEPVSRPGDVFRFGEHVIGCGDGTSTEVMARLMGEIRADLALTDFPYNVPGSRIGGRGSIGPRDFV